MKHLSDLGTLSSRTTIHSFVAFSKQCLLSLLVLIASATMVAAQSGSLQEPVEPVNIIMDSDLAHNADDVGDHAMLWAMSARGEASVLALIISSTNDYSAPCARAIARYYGHPSVPIGANKENIPNDYAAYFSYYTQQVATQFGTPGETRFDYPDAVTVYRQALAGAADHSVYIVSGGYYRPLMRLLQSGPDAISPLSGLQLVTQKVVRLIIVAGSFPDSGTTDRGNLLIDPDSASYVVANWPVEIVWMPDDQAWDVVTGPAASTDPTTNPIALAYSLYCNNGQYCANNTPGWTQLGLLYGIRGGLGTNFVAGGRDGSSVVWDSTTTMPGRVIWSQTPDRNHSYLLKSISGATMAAIINPLVQWIPSAVNQAPIAYSQTVTSNNGAPVLIVLRATDPDGRPLAYTVLTSPQHGTLTGTPPDVTYTPAAGYSGTDSFTFSANDGVLNSNIAVVSINVTVNQAPIAYSQTVTSNNGAPVLIVLRATDPDGDPLAYTVLTSPQHGTLTGTPPNVTYTPAAGYSGTDSFTFSANDGVLNSNIAVVSINVTVNQAPIAYSQTVTSNNGAPVLIILTATDPDGDSLAYTVLTSPQHGTLTGTPPNVTYTPAAGYSGTDSFTFSANDGITNSNIATIAITVTLSSGLQEPVEPVNIIMDSDMAHSPDDVGDHAMLWALAARGEVNVLALILSSTNDYSASCAHAIASYYGHPNVLIGANKGSIPGTYAAGDSAYTQQVTNQFGTAGDSRANYPDAATVYRQALANAPDHSVYIVNGGYYRPMYDLLQSGPDAISPLTGLQLVAQKVRRAVFSAGRFPDSGSSPEGNLANDPDSASYVVANWPTEIVWLGYDEGWNVITGPAANADPATNPVKLAYNLYCQNGTWCANNFPAWTQIALLYAVRGGLGTNFIVGGQNGSTVVWGSTTATPGRSIWSQTPDWHHAYLQKAILATDMAAILNPLVQWIPSANPVLSGLTLTPNSVTGGNPCTGAVALSAVAPDGGIQIMLTSSNTAAATVPPTVTVLAGSNSASFSVTTNAVSTSASTTISASYAGITLTAQLTVQPAILLDQFITFAPLAPRTYGDPAFTVSASASSGLPVTFTVGATDNCSISSGNLVTLTGAGTCTITAHQGGNSTYNPAPDVAQNFTIAKATATIQLAGLNAIYDGTPKPVTATTNPSGLAVSITYNGSPTAPINAGSYSVIATINNNNYQGSATGTLVISTAATVVSLTSSLNPSVFGQSVSFTAVVSSAAGTPIGSITFYDGTTVLGTATLNASGWAVLSTSALSTATHSITAVYGGGTNFQSSTSFGFSQVVNRAATSTTLSSSPNPSLFGQAVTLTATVNATNSVPTGTITFSDGTTVLGSSQTNSSGRAVLVVTTLAVGGHTLRATYAGGGDWLGSTSSALTQTVNRASSTTTLTSSVNPSSLGQQVTFTATVTTSVAVATGTIQFRDGSSILATVALDSTGQALFTTSALAPGNHTIRAVYSGDTRFRSSSSSLAQTVVSSTTTTLTSSPNPSTMGQTVTFTAIVSAPTGTPRGTVVFRDGTTALGSANLNSAQRAVFRTSQLLRGSHSITATYNGTTGFLPSTSAPLTQQVN